MTKTRAAIIPRRTFRSLAHFQLFTLVLLEPATYNEMRNGPSCRKGDWGRHSNAPDGGTSKSLLTVARSYRVLTDLKPVENCRVAHYRRGFSFRINFPAKGRANAALLIPGARTPRRQPLM